MKLIVLGVSSASCLSFVTPHRNGTARCKHPAPSTDVDIGEREGGGEVGEGGEGGGEGVRRGDGGC